MLLALQGLANNWAVAPSPASQAAFNSEIQKLSQTAKLEFFEIDLTALGDTVYRFHAGTNELKTPVVWQGLTYQPWPAKAKGFDFNTSAQLPRPVLSLGNVNGTVTALVLLLNDCVGGKVTRRITMKKFVDAVNFAGGNPTADPNAHYADEIYYIDRKATEDDETVDFELTAAFDVMGVQLPRRQVIQNVCPWRYRGAGCGYAGTNYFTADGTPTANPALDVCGKSLNACKLRFGADNELPFGGFPGVGLVQ